MTDLDLDLDRELDVDGPLDAERWLYVHEAQVVGLDRALAVDVITQAGLASEVIEFGGNPSTAPFADPRLIRLRVGSDGRVRAAHSG
jgi:hypothetical protein